MYHFIKSTIVVKRHRKSQDETHLQTTCDRSYLTCEDQLKQASCIINTERKKIELL